MKRSTFLVTLTLAAVIGVSALAPAPAVAKSSDDQVTLEGVVRKAEFNNRGVVRRVFIQTPEDSVLVVKRDKGKELLQHVGATVKVTGYMLKVTRDANFSNQIDITEYAITMDAPQRAPRP